MRRFPFVATLTPGLFALTGGPAPAAPARKVMVIVSPVAAAKTFQVTETYYTCGDGSAPGPLRLGAAMTFCVKRPDKFRVATREYGASPSAPSLYASDGQRLVYKDAKETKQWPAATHEWPFPLMGLMNMPGPVSVVPAVRNGRRVLLAVQVMGPGDGSRVETLYDTRSHLPLEQTMLMTWQGKTSAVVRTVYTGWVLNRPLAASVFKP